MDEDDDGALRTSIAVPLNTIPSDLESAEDRNLEFDSFCPLTPASIGNPRFRLPEGWEVLQVRRSVGNQIDKYYYKPGTDVKFRSMKEVERYLNGHGYTPPSRSRPPAPQKTYKRSAMKVDNISDHDQLTIASSSRTPVSSHFKLPDGWVVERVPRKDTGHTDKFYYEPETGLKFRSLISVERYLSEINDEDVPLSKMFKLSDSHVKAKLLKKSEKRKRTSEDKINSSAMDFSRRSHVKIKWVLADPGDGSWDAFIGQKMIPEHIRQLWEVKFKSSIT